VQANLLQAVTAGGYDVVHGFDPGLPSLSYLALRDSDALTVATAKEPPGSPSPTAAALHADPAGAFVASRRSPVFHRADCPAAATIAPHNRIVFDGRDGAVASGRRPAEDCHP